MRFEYDRKSFLLMRRKLLEANEMDYYKSVHHTMVLEEKKMTDVVTQEIVGQSLGIKTDIFTASIRHYAKQSEE